MRFNLKKELSETFTPPEPKDRDSFLASIPYPKLTYGEFIFSQLGYIRKRIWFVSAAIMLAAAGTVCILPESGMTLVWFLSALTPFLAALTAAEISRSDIFGMSEIESACRFAVPQVTAARMLILGVCNFVVIALLTAISGIYTPIGFARSVLYIFTPYAAVNGLSLWIFGRAKGQDGVYLSAAAALAVSLSGGIMSGRNSFDERLMNIFYITVCIAGTAAAAVQLKKNFFGKERFYETEN